MGDIAAVAMRHCGGCSFNLGRGKGSCPVCAQGKNRRVHLGPREKGGRHHPGQMETNLKPPTRKKGWGGEQRSNIRLSGVLKPRHGGRDGEKVFPCKWDLTLSLFFALQENLHSHFVGSSRIVRGEKDRVIKIALCWRRRETVGLQQYSCKKKEGTGSRIQKWREIFHPLAAFFPGKGEGREVTSPYAAITVSLLEKSLLFQMAPLPSPPPFLPGQREARHFLAGLE